MNSSQDASSSPRIDINSPFLPPPNTPETPDKEPSPYEGMHYTLDTPQVSVPVPPQHNQARRTTNTTYHASVKIMPTTGTVKNSRGIFLGTLIALIVVTLVIGGIVVVSQLGP